LKSPLLLPLSSPQGGDAIIARSLENAARLAATEQTGVTIDLRVYNTDGNPATAASVARQAVQEGADVILGPLRSESAAAVGVAVANSGVAVLSFSNNAEVAGGNVFVLGNTFANTSDRIVSYAARQGAGNIVVVHASNLAGEVARDAVRRAAARSGATIAASVPYEFSQTGVINAVPQVVDAVRNNGANGVLLTSDSAGALPFFAQLLPENGLDLETVRVLGLTRWDTPPQTLEFAGPPGRVVHRAGPGRTRRVRGEIRRRLRFRTAHARIARLRRRACGRRNGGGDGAGRRRRPDGLGRVPGCRRRLPPAAGRHQPEGAGDRPSDRKPGGHH
jgi:ABC-type branched-subunit amino acid transport system substrate-binding protein